MDSLAFIDSDVVIIGGGPVGLALAGDLGWRGISCVLIERSDGSIYQPKMDGINVRTMEFCRRWGLVDAIKACPYPSNYLQDMVYLTSLGGYELGRESFLKPSTGNEQSIFAQSPETRVRCPQNMFDPILRAFAQSRNSVRLRYETRFTSFTEYDDRVEVEIEDVRTGKLATVRAAYLVGCDGGTSDVRTQLRFAMQGRGTLTHSTNVIIRCADLASRHDKRLAYRHLFVGPEGTWATMVAINGRDEWRFSFIGSLDSPNHSEPEVRALVDRAIGFPVDYEVVSVVPWTRRELIAEHYGSDRAFIAGDAAHVMSPTGGFGMNTGIGDAVDLAWKLDGALRGWGGASLLASYEAERRPVAIRAAREASGNLARTLSPGSNPRLLEASVEGALLRYDVGRRFSATLLREWYKNGIDLGYEYADSPICLRERGGEPPAEPAAKVPVDAVAALPPGWFTDCASLSAATLREWQRLCVHRAESYPVTSEDPELPPEEVMLYRPRSSAGARAPHVWLPDGRSTLDLFGRGYVLLRLGRDAPDPTLLLEAAARRGVPLSVETCDERDMRDAYGRRLVLVRPDGHIAWSGDRWPGGGIESLMDRVRGANDSLAAHDATRASSPASAR